jgi:ribosomal protein S18 acetylase RimI-like enzyme
MITHLEELSLNAFPSLQTGLYDGWVLRFADGYTRRANSVNALYPSSLDVDKKIALCEAAYSARGQRTQFKITPAVHPANLDAILAEKGYEKEALTAVQTLDLRRVAQATTEGVALAGRASEVWLAALCRLSSVEARHHDTVRRVLESAVPQMCFAAVFQDETIVAVGLAVLERGFVGLFDIVTEARWRKRGFGTQLVGGLLAWGRESGAERAYLQVMCDNAPALRLYARLGFGEEYRYWYRVKAVG